MTQYRCAIIVLLCFLCIPALPLQAGEPDAAVDVTQLFSEANQAYNEGRYEDAAGYYQKLISSGCATADMYYNLGNAFYKSSAPGKAIVQYRKALLLAPRSDDAQANLGYALEQTVDKIECSGAAAVLRDFCFWYPLMTAGELCAVFLIAHFLFWLLRAVRYSYRTDFLTIALYLTLFVALVFGASFGVKLYAAHLAPDGIVIAREIMVRAGTSVNDTVLFKLHEGAAFTWKDESGQWVKIELCDGKRGWAQKETVEKITL